MFVVIVLSAFPKDLDRFWPYEFEVLDQAANGGKQFVSAVCHDTL